MESVVAFVETPKYRQSGPKVFYNFIVVVMIRNKSQKSKFNFVLEICEKKITSRAIFWPTATFSSVKQFNLVLAQQNA